MEEETLKKYSVKCYRPTVLFELNRPIRLIKNLITLPELLTNPLTEAYISFSEPLLTEESDELSLPKGELLRGQLKLNISLLNTWQFNYKSNRSLDEVTLNHINRFGGEIYIPNATKQREIVIHKNLAEEQIAQIKNFYRELSETTKDYKHLAEILSEERLLVV